MNPENPTQTAVTKAKTSSITSASPSIGSETAALGWYLKSAIFLLVVTGLAKLLSLAGHAKILDATDPLLGLAYRWVMLGSGAAELLLAALIWSHFGRRFRMILVFWLGMAFCAYHGVVALLDPGAPCPCLGTISGQFGLTPRAADRLAVALAGYFLAGPLAIWAMSALKTFRTPPLRVVGGRA